MTRIHWTRGATLTARALSVLTYQQERTARNDHLPVNDWRKSTGALVEVPGR